MKKQDPQYRFFSYQHGEGRTGIGQKVRFTCPPDDVEQIRVFLQTHVRTIEPQATRHVLTSHGAYGRYSRYEIVQHRYAGGECGYIEVLEIKDPPDGRWGIVVHEYVSGRGVTFMEWETVEHACAAFECYWGTDNAEDKFAKLPGFRRSVACGYLTPWFYAVGDECLVGDYAFPEDMQDDPVYRFGRKFVVFGCNGIPSVKTCMGTRLIQQKREERERPYRLVSWDDGSVWDERHQRDDPPRPMEDGELWIVEAIQQFREMLVGKRAEFFINFTDGNKFVGKLVKHRRASCAAGDYFLVVRLKDRKEPLEGWVKDFQPTQEAPDVVQYVTQCYARNGKEVEYVEITDCKTKRGGKKWAGVFFRPSR